jgi:hypothetical protein
MPYSTTVSGYSAETLHNPYTSLHSYLGFRISEELIGGYKIEFNAFEIIVSNEDILAFKYYVAAKAG